MILSQQNYHAPDWNGQNRQGNFINPSSFWMDRAVPDAKKRCIQKGGEVGDGIYQNVALWIGP